MLRDMPRTVRDGRFALLAIGALLGSWPSAFATEPLHARIDQLIEAAPIGPAAPPAGDAEFLRRLSLDVRGTIPTAAEVRTFLDDPAPDKRAAWVERLFADPAYARHMSDVFDVMLMERRGDTHVKTEQWKQYLLESFRQNKPYNVLVREILSADGADDAWRPAARFYLERLVEPHLLTRDVGRVFFGRDLQCCQCHDHPLIADYFQSDYYGLYAFFDRSYLFTDKDNKVFVAEKADSKVAYQSVFDPDAKGVAVPALPGEATVDEPHVKRVEEYVVAPADNVRPVPKYSRRVRLAELVAAGGNAAFNRNIANRLWAQMMGRGLVEPADLHHPENPPTHPELLALLADEFAAMQFDIRAFLRELALSHTYQRSIEVSPDGSQGAIAAEQLAALQARRDQLASAADESDAATSAAREVWTTAESAAAPLAEELAKAKTAVEAALKPASDATAALAQFQAQLAVKQEQLTLLKSALAKAKGAAEKLSNEAELTQAVATFEARVQQVGAELPGLEQQTNEKAAAAKQAGEALASADQVVEDTVARLPVAREPVTAANAEFARLESARQSAKTLVAATEQQIAALDQVLRYADLLKSLTAARDALQQAEHSRDAASQLVIEKETALKGPQTALAEVQTLQQSAVQALNVAEQQLNRHREVRAAVAEAARTTEIALEKLPGDSELGIAAEKLKSRMAGLTAETAALEAGVSAARLAGEAADQQVKSAEQVLAAAIVELTTTQRQLAEATVQVETVAGQVDAAAAAVETAEVELLDTSSQTFASVSLTPLAPEQLAWSCMQATGYVDQQRTAVAAELQKAAADQAAQAAAKGESPPATTPDTAQLEQTLYERLTGQVPPFVGLFGGGAGQPDQFFATVDQALFFANGGLVKSWLAPGGGNLGERLMGIEDPRVLADELYVSILSRRPVDAEIDAVVEYLSQRSEQKSEAVQELAWALLTSTEFRFRH